MKKNITVSFLILGIILISGCILNEQKAFNNPAMIEQLTALQKQISVFDSQIETLKSENDQLKKENETMKIDISSVNSGNEELKEENRFLKEEIGKYKNNESLTTNQNVEKGIINGKLSYGSDFMPAMKICAVNTISKEETCVNNNEDSYSISVSPGSYLVYSKILDDNRKVYYTKCDTYDNKFIPECNPNAGDLSAGWYKKSFKCYEDNDCKSVFTPLQITVPANGNISLKSIEQGYYIPCSYETETCNNANFDVWADYLK